MSDFVVDFPLLNQSQGFDAEVPGTFMRLVDTMVALMMLRYERVLDMSCPRENVNQTLRRKRNLKCCGFIASHGLPPTTNPWKKTQSEFQPSPPFAPSGARVRE